MTTWLPVPLSTWLVVGIFALLALGAGICGICWFLRAILTLPLDEKDER